MSFFIKKDNTKIEMIIIVTISKVDEVISKCFKIKEFSIIAEFNGLNIESRFIYFINQ